MKLLTLAACAAAALTFAGSAMAESPLTAKLQAPAAKTKFIAGGSIFLCSADACTANATTSTSYSNDTCRAVAKAAGPLSAFGDGQRSFDADRLAACNSVVSTRLAKS